MGRLIFVIEQKVLLIFFLISSISAPKNKSKSRALFSECGVAYEAGKKKNHSILATKN